MNIRSIIIATTLLVWGYSCSTEKAMAQTTADAVITTSAIADISADEVWAQIRKLDNIPELSSAVGSLTWTGPKGVGGQRKCVTPDKSGFFIEKIREFNDQERTYEWQVVEGVPASNVINRFRVVDLGYNRCMVVFTSRFQFIENPNMTEEQFKAFLQSASYEMATNAIALAQ